MSPVGQQSASNNAEDAKDQMRSSNMRTYRSHVVCLEIENFPQEYCSKFDGAK